MFLLFVFQQANEKPISKLALTSTITGHHYQWKCRGKGWAPNSHLDFSKQIALIFSMFWIRNNGRTVELWKISNEPLAEIIWSLITRLGILWIESRRFTIVELVQLVCASRTIFQIRPNLRNIKCTGDNGKVCRSWRYKEKWKVRPR